MVEFIQTDIWVRFQRLRGHRCLWMWADDTHGTSIMIRARQEGRSEVEVIAEMKAAHERDFHAFGLSFDNYGSTNSPENRAICHEIWKRVTDAGLVIEKNVVQFYDPKAQTYLADRFIRGTCPKCGAKNQYGDHCGKCLANYTPKDLIDPRSALSDAVPELREQPHRFIQLEQLHDFLAEWTQSGEHLQTEVTNYLKGHFLGVDGDPNNPRKELMDWDVTRPPEYFGFEVPDFPGNYWYVWFDAPIGYIASTQQWCDANGEQLDDWWRNDDVEIHHFIGKDITYFHTLFWPGILKTAGYSLPTKVHIHGFLTVGGEKMSKSEGTFIMASTYLAHLDPSYLRYYFASKLGPRLDDLDLDFEDFRKKVDSDLVGKVVNRASRSAKFVAGQSLSATYPDDNGLFSQGAAAGERIASLYENCDYNGAMREIMQLADRANQYVDSQEPWKIRKDETRAEELRDVCSVTLNLFRQIVVYLAPVLPRLAEQTAELLGAPIQHWEDSQTPLTGTPVGQFQHMLTRVDPNKVEAMIEDSKESLADGAESTAAGAATPFNDGPEAMEKEPLVAEHCTIDDLMKVDMRVARVLEANHVEGADKLLQLTLSLGGEERRNVFAGIKSVYQPEDLVGRLVICCANLAPRKMRFGLSEGMVLACGPGGKEIFLLNPDDGAKPGMRVH
ncbi:MAG: methionine--tRNA ligase [Planctomycetaceae bacterium]